MILDRLTEFADSVAVSGAAGTQNVGNALDLQGPPPNTIGDIGNGWPVYWVVTIEEAPTGADTVEFHLVSDAVDPPATDGSATLHATTGDVAIADLPAGKTFCIALPLEGNLYERFLGLHVTNVGAGALADLVVNSFLTLDPHGWQAYPDAQN